MSEHDDRYASSDLPRTTGEFRAAPDVSASTAEFKAFASGLDRDIQDRGASSGSWPEQPWAGESVKSGSGRTIAIAAAVVVAIVVVIVLIVAVG
jgi:hypothetical protein